MKLLEEFLCNNHSALFAGLIEAGITITSTTSALEAI
jgi:hypothetical protein